MTPYAVEWTQDAEDDLAHIWLPAADPQEVSRAAADADALLARDPLRRGSEIHEGLWKLVAPPLAIYYEVDATRSVVVVSGVGSVG